MKNILISGLPGKMAIEVAKHVVASQDMNLVEVALSGEKHFGSDYRVGGKDIVCISQQELSRMLGKKYDPSKIMVVDYTEPAAVKPNIDFYKDMGLNFVMGTTGGDADRIKNTLATAGNISAVVAPNMAKPIVLVQSMFEWAADTFPNALEGFVLYITESHQKRKKDTSGTAKAMIRYFNKLGVKFVPEQIKMIRDPEEQRNLGIPETHLEGHGRHNYVLINKELGIRLEFVHNVNGRKIYASGTMDALRFLLNKLQNGSKGEVFSMIDVLKAGRRK